MRSTLCITCKIQDVIPGQLQCSDCRRESRNETQRRYRKKKKEREKQIDDIVVDFRKFLVERWPH